MFSFLSDEDMQSLASLMSVKPTDIGNLDDFNESDEEEDKKSGPAAGLGLLPDLHCCVFLLTAALTFVSSLPSLIVLVCWLRSLFL